MENKITSEKDQLIKEGVEALKKKDQDRFMQLTTLLKKEVKKTS